MVGQNESSTRKSILSHEKILTWHEKTLGRLFYPLFGQENCFSLAALGLKQLFSFPTIGKNKFLPLVFPCLANFFHMTGIYILAHSDTVLTVTRKQKWHHYVGICLLDVI